MINTLKKCASSSEVVATEPCLPPRNGNFEELVQNRLITRRNSFTEGKSSNYWGDRRSTLVTRTPDMFLALIGDKDISDPESLSISDGEETTSKDSVKAVDNAHMSHYASSANE